MVPDGTHVRGISGRSTDSWFLSVCSVHSGEEGGSSAPQAGYLLVASSPPQRRAPPYPVRREALECVAARAGATVFVDVFRPAARAVLCAALFVGMEVAEEVEEYFGSPSACTPLVRFLDAERRLMRAMLGAPQYGRVVRVNGQPKWVCWRVNPGGLVDFVAMG